MKGKYRTGRYTPKRRRRRREGGKTGLIIALLLFFLIILICAAVYMTMRWNADQAASVPLESSREVVPESIPDQNSGSNEDKVQAHAAVPGASAQDILKTMTLEEKAAQLFIITPEALTGVERVYSAGAATRERINRYPVGGLIYSPANLESPEQIKNMLDHVRQYSKERVGVPMLTITDEKGSIHTAKIVNSAFNDQISGIAASWASGEEEKVYESAQTIGTYLKDMGFNLIFATAADVSANAEGSVLTKKYPESGGEVLARFAVQELNGFEKAGVKMLMRSFPGPSLVNKEVNQGYPYIEKGLGGLLSDELIPFKAGIDAGIDFIMAGHIAVPSITGDDEPSSMSGVMINDVLRGSLEYQGIIVTDSLGDEKLAQQYTQEEASVKAIQAGADMLLTPSDFEASYRGLINAVKTGVIPEERIDQSVLRILKIKIGFNE